MQEVTNEIFKPIMVNAIYTDQILEEYGANPFIEALPPIWTEDDVIEQLSLFPPFNEKERELDSSYRYHCIQRLFQYFQPFEKHLELEQKISRAIRQGYICRNPLDKTFTQMVNESYQAIKERKFLSKYKTKNKSTALGFTIIGLSGIGKSTAIERILSLYPQLIRHREYQEKPLIYTQISWLKLDCPFDGNIKGLCISFFSELDRLLGSNYVNKFGTKTINLMLQRMAHLSSLHGVGLIIIDEIQHLSLAKSGGADKMLNFFVTVVNTIGVPVILVGTNKAVSILQKELRQAKRGIGQGGMEWNQVPKDETWELFMEGLWEYQWTKKYTPYNQKLSDLIYDQSQGILDIAVKLFMLSQVMAISNEEEKISMKIIKQVSKDSLSLVKPMLDALRSGIPSKIAEYEDIRPIDFDEEVEKYKASIDLKDKIRIQKKLQKQKRDKKEQTLLEEVTLQLLAMDFDGKEVQSVIKKVLEKFGEELDKSNVLKETVKILIEKDGLKERAKVVNKKSSQSNNDYLGHLFQEAKKGKKSIYEYFLSKGIIKSPLAEQWKDDAGHDSYVSHSLS